MNRISSYVKVSTIGQIRNRKSNGQRRDQNRQVAVVSFLSSCRYLKAMIVLQSILRLQHVGRDQSDQSLLPVVGSVPVVLETAVEMRSRCPRELIKSRK